MRDLTLSHERERWTVKLDVRDLGGHLDTTLRGWSATLASTVKVVMSRLVLISLLQLDFHGRLRSFGLCLFLLLSMVLRPLCWPSVVCVSCALLFQGLSGLVVSLWPQLVR